jgi:polysaccharide export outer membrane protein
MHLERYDVGLRGFKAAVLAIAVVGLPWSAALADARPSVTTAGALPPPDPPGIDQQQSYRIGPLDVLEISVFQVDSLARTVQVDAGGHIALPFIGSVVALGKTPQELGADIAKRLGDTYIQSPQVTVFVKESLSQKFTVEGAVKAPGVFPLVGNMTLLRAVATAQGPDLDAKLHDVVIFRQVNQKTVGEVVNLSQVRAGKVTDPQIYAGDVVVVMTSPTRRALHDLVSITPLLFFVHP